VGVENRGEGGGGVYFPLGGRHRFLMVVGVGGGGGGG